MRIEVNYQKDGREDRGIIGVRMGDLKKDKITGKVKVRKEKGGRVVGDEG